MTPIPGGPPARLPSRTAVLLLAFGFMLPLAGCGGSGSEGRDGPETVGEGIQELALGPADGYDLPATDLERVVVGTLAPDFTLKTISGEALTLSSYRGAKNVVLVFYRGHW